VPSSKVHQSATSVETSILYFGKLIFGCDPIEANSLGEFFKEYMPEEPEGRKPLKIGSVKTNIGHLESAAGVAGI
jgi:hypothetical protein